MAPPRSTGKRAARFGVVFLVHHLVRHALECLPLATAEFATAVNRLENARAYLDTGEPGAARFELLLLLRSLEPEPTPSDE